jgi:hypothetical protein
MSAQPQAGTLEVERPDTAAQDRGSSLNRSRASTIGQVNSQEPGGFVGSDRSQASGLERPPADSHQGLLRISGDEWDMRFDDGIYRVLPNDHVEPEQVEVELSVVEQAICRHR